MKNENNSVNEELKQDIEETGPDFKKVRESKGLTLRDLFKSTRIRISILEAIESEEFHLLPESLYTKTFMKTYAQALGVDSKKIISRYAQYLEQRKSSREKKDKSKSCMSEFYNSRRNYPRWILTGLFIAVFVIFLLYPKNKQEDVKNEVADKSETAVIVKEAEPQPAVVEKQAEEPKTKIEEEATVSREDIADKQSEVVETAYKMTIEANELVWLNITVDDKPPQEILLRPGEKIYKEASKGFIIDVGNAGGVNLTFQGESLGSLGKHGQVIHLVLPKDIEH